MDQTELNRGAEMKEPGNKVGAAEPEGIISVQQLAAVCIRAGSLFFFYKRIPRIASVITFKLVSSLWLHERPNVGFRENHVHSRKSHTIPTIEYFSPIRFCLHCEPP